MIQAGCPQGGVVLDPFVGSGTTLAVAETFGCSGIGIDICGDYLELSKQRILQSRNSRDTEQDTPNGDSIVRN
jgi:DNA modification methylase